MFQRMDARKEWKAKDREVGGGGMREKQEKGYYGRRRGSENEEVIRRVERGLERVMRKEG